MPSRKPLDPKLIESACILHAQLDSWRKSDEALMAAARALPGFGSAETLIKVVLVNSLYYTNVFAVTRVADHFSRLLQNTGPRDWTAETVESMAKVSLDAGGVKQKRLISLASKFAHFFLDTEHFPIYDEYAKRMLAYHTGHSLTLLESSYALYCGAFDDLARTSGVGDWPRKLDRYLWVQGQYMEYEKKINAPNVELSRVNVELNRVFEAGGWPPK